MSERPIIMRADEVCAILDGRKAQFRRATGKVLWGGDNLRVVVDKPCWGEGVRGGTYTVDPGVYDAVPTSRHGLYAHIKAPSTHPRYGRATRGLSIPHPCWVSPFGQPGDLLTVKLETHIDGPRKVLDMLDESGPILLRVTDVRVEQLQAISEADANKEGCPLPASDQDWGQCRSWFRSLLDSLNAKPGERWEDNPWVWVVEFEQVTP